MINDWAPAVLLFSLDEKAGRWDKYAAKNADSGTMFNP
jgi:hypothetical protein